MHWQLNIYLDITGRFSSLFFLFFISVFCIVILSINFFFILYIILEYFYINKKKTEAQEEMTNSTQSQWEVAGSKKVKGYDSDSKRTAGMTTRNSKSNLSTSKIPVIETLRKEKSTTEFSSFY